MLVQLNEDGLVEKIISKPQEFHAISVEKCVSKLIQRRIIKTEELAQKALKLIEDLEHDTANEELNEKFEFIVIPNKDALYAKTVKMPSTPRSSFKSLIVMFIFDSGSKNLMLCKLESVLSQ